MEKTKQIIIDFVEGKIKISDFKHFYDTNKDSFKILFKNYKSSFISDKYERNIIKLLENIDWTTTKGQFEIFDALRWFLAEQKISVIPTEEYFNQLERFYQIIPSWLSDEASDYVEEEIIEKAPKGLTKTETKAWIKARIKETFKYEKRPPQWAQEGNWPRDEEGNFLTFRSQKEDGDLVTYIFVNPKTGEEVQTQEFY